MNCCINRRKPVLVRTDRGGTLRYAWLRAPPLSNPNGRQQGARNSTDPLGRPQRNNEFNDDYSVKIPGEIDVQRVRRILEELRRRLADPARPQIELDYIERLLKDY